MKKLGMLLIACFVVCVAAQSLNHTIVLKPKEYSEIEVDCSQGDLLKISARSADESYFYVEIMSPFGQKVFSEGNDEVIVGEYKVPASGVYTIRIANYALFSDVTVNYAISRTYKVLFIDRTGDLKLPGSIT